MSGSRRPASAGQQPLAVTSAERWPASANLPTVAESFPSYEAVLWFGMWAPKGTPAAIVERLNAAANKALREPDVERNITSSGLRTVGGALRQFADRIRTDVELEQGRGGGEDQAGVKKSFIAKGAEDTVCETTSN